MVRLDLYLGARLHSTTVMRLDLGKGLEVDTLALRCHVETVIGRVAQQHYQLLTPQLFAHGRSFGWYRSAVGRLLATPSQFNEII